MSGAGGAMSGTGKVVGVTGASGFIASLLVKELLQRGYTVNASLRFPDYPKRSYKHLLELDGAKERLHLFEADLEKYHSFDSCFTGCDGVFHTASPYINDNVVKDPDGELLVPALYGTCNVLGSIARTPSVKKLVLTSSTEVVIHNGTPLTEKVVVDETWFSDPQLCKESKMWNALVKTLAEQAAWNLVKGKGIADVVVHLPHSLWKIKEEELAEWETIIRRIVSIDMVTINPATVISPFLQPVCNESVRLILELKDSVTYPNELERRGWVHVKDVVKAHIRAYENQYAEGRYCIVESVANYSDIVDKLRECFPSLTFPDARKDLLPKYNFSKQKAKEGLGIVDYIPLEEGLDEVIKSDLEYKSE